MPALQIRLKKGRDGPHSLVCTRADGTMTMQRQRTGFFPLHDLTHYAVESVLDYRRGFWGLVAEGWDLSDFGAPWPRGPLPADLDPSELIVGALDLERGTGHALTATDLNARVREWYALNAPTLPLPAEVSAEQLAAARELAAELHARWLQTPPGAALELSFFISPPVPNRRSND